MFSEIARKFRSAFQLRCGTPHNYAVVFFGYFFNGFAACFESDFIVVLFNEGEKFFVAVFNYPKPFFGRKLRILYVRVGHKDDFSRHFYLLILAEASA